MPDDATPHLGLPYIVAAQAHKHVTHNEALQRLDTLVHLAVLDKDLATPPGSPTDGQRWIVAASPTGAWAGHAMHIAAWQDGAWQFSAPQAGWVAFVVDEGTMYFWNGSAWGSILGVITVLQNLALLGVGTTADATNPFSAKLNKALWTAKTAAEGGDGDLRYTMNKETASDVLSLLMQTGFSERAEIGLIGDDNLTFKVSPDGSTFVTAIIVDKTTGALTLAVKLAVAQGGTGASTAAAARVNLGVDQLTSHGDSAYTILATDRVVGTSASLTAPRTWTLPAANSFNAGQRLLVTDIAGGVTATNTLTLARAGSDTINGATSHVISTTNGTIELVSDGVSKWSFDVQGLSRGGTGATTAAAARTALGLGSAATVNTGTSGGTVPLLNGANTFSAQELFEVDAANAETVPLALRNGGGIGSGSTAVSIDFDPAGNGIGVRSARLKALNNGANQISLLLQTSNGGALSTGFTVRHDQVIRFDAYGAGTLTTDASGNVTASSDARLKDVIGPFSRGLGDLRKMDRSVLYTWKAETAAIAQAKARLSELKARQASDLSDDERAQVASEIETVRRLADLDHQPTYAGWTAQAVRKGIPEAVFEGPDGMLTLSERAILAAAVNALLEADDKIAALEARIDAVESSRPAPRGGNRRTPV